MPLLLCIIIGLALAFVNSRMPLFSLTPWMPFAGGMYLLLSGLELRLREVSQEKLLIAKLWAGAFVFPFAAGMVLVYAWPSLFEPPTGVGVGTSAFILAVALAVSAVPVILKIMQEMGWMGTRRAQRVVLTAILCDLSAWGVFFPLLPSSDAAHWFSSHLPLLMFFVGLILSYFLTNFFKLRRCLGLANQWIFASIFFIGVGQSLYLSQSLNVLQVVVIFVVATISKMLGASLTARWAGLNKTESFATGMALNARGAMEILLASFAFRQGLIAGDLITSARL